MALSFSGSTADRMSYAGGIVFNGDVTILADVNPSNVTAGNRKGIVYLGLAMNGLRNDVLSLQLSGNEVWGIKGGGNGDTYAVAVKSGVVAGVWQRVFMRVKGNAYLDAGLAGVAGTADTTTLDWTTQTMGQVHVGCDQNSKTNTLAFPFLGGIGPVAIFNDFLGIDEIFDYESGARPIERMRPPRAYWLLTVTGSQANLATNQAYILSQVGSVPTAGTSPTVTSYVADGSLSVLLANQRYLTRDGRTAIMLAGAHTWCNVIDIGISTGFPPPAFDWQTYYDAQLAKGQNFFRLWPNDYSQESSTEVHAPLPWSRPGPGNAADGQLKFDLTSFDSTYFSRLRTRAQYLGARNAYVTIPLFEGWGAQFAPAPWRVNGHPFASGNNINGISADANANGFVEEVYSLSNAAITAIQEALIRKTVDETHDLSFVLYEPCNEASFLATPRAWQRYVIDYLRWYQRTKPATYRQLVWRTPGGTADESLTSSRDGGDLTAPNSVYTGYSTTVPALVGTDTIPYFYDTDHIDPSNATVVEVWKAFLRGHGGVAYMDDPNGFVFTPVAAIRDALGHIVSYSKRLLLHRCSPSTTLSSTGYCLAESGSQYLVLQPGSGAFIVDLSAATGKFVSVEWLNTNDGATQYGGIIAAGSSTQTLTPPFGGSPSGVVALVTVVTRAGLDFSRFPKAFMRPR